MKKELEFLNDVKVSLEEYQEVSLTPLEKERMLWNMKQKLQKKNRGYKKYAVLAACFTLLVAAAQTSFAKEMWDQFLAVIRLKNIEIVQIDPQTLPSDRTIPPEHQGIYYDKDGNELTQYQPEMYDKDGNVIVVGAGEQEKIPTFTFSSWEDAQKYLSFQAKQPNYIPEGFHFDRLETYEADETKPTDYLDAYYVNDAGEFYLIQQRRSSPETGYATGASETLQQVEINGHKAALSDQRNLDWEADGVILSIMGRGCIGTEDLMKIAQSMK